MPKSYSYISSPYSSGRMEGKDRNIEMDWRYREAMRFVAWCTRKGKKVFSPIVHMHQVAKFHELPVDFQFWKDYNESMIWPASEFIVLQLPGWDESTGVKKELEVAQEVGLKILYADPEGQAYTWKVYA